MIPRKSVVAALSTACLALGASPAMAQPSQKVVEALVDQLVNQGYTTEIRIRQKGNTLEVEASGPSSSTERVYSRDGNQLFEEETERADGTRVEREYDSAGRLMSEEYERDEDDNDDRDDDRDEDDNDDRDDDDDDDDDGDDGDDDDDN